MKKTYLARRNALLSSANLSWGMLALLFAVFALVVRLLAPNFFWHTVAPAFRVSDAIAVKTHTFFAGFSDVAALAVKNEQLVREHAALANENQTLTEKLASIQALIGTVGLQKGILAGVVSRPPESPYDTLLVAAGSNEEVALGMEVFGAGDVPLGIVSSVTADFSRVTLFSAPSMVTHGWVGHASIPLSIFGAGAGAMVASLSRSANVAIGDIVFAPGPGMLPIGKVIRVDSNPSAPDATLRIAPSVNPFSITWVLLRDTGGTLRSSFSVATSTP